VHASETNAHLLGVQGRDVAGGLQRGPDVIHNALRHLLVRRPHIEEHAGRQVQPCQWVLEGQGLVKAAALDQADGLAVVHGKLQLLPCGEAGVPLLAVSRCPKHDKQFASVEGTRNGCGDVVAQTRVAHKGRDAGVLQGVLELEGGPVAVLAEAEGDEHACHECCPLSVR
jgi:hypothetical protein